MRSNQNWKGDERGFAVYQSRHPNVYLRIEGRRCKDWCIDVMVCCEERMWLGMIGFEGQRADVDPSLPTIGGKRTLVHISTSARSNDHPAPTCLL